MPNIRVEVIYALPERQYLRKVVLQKGSTLKEAIQNSGLLDIDQNINLKINKVGIFSQFANLEDSLNDGDRVEIYRQLLIEPNELRRLRSRRKKE